jgi:hypothetical protein
LTKRNPKVDLRRALTHLENGDWQAAHGIVHIMEGDRSNARYWFRRAGRRLDADTAAAQEIKALKAEIGSDPDS